MPPFLIAPLFDFNSGPRRTANLDFSFITAQWQNSEKTFSLCRPPLYAARELRIKKQFLSRQLLPVPFDHLLFLLC